jgi:hypothetical protein
MLPRVGKAAPRRNGFEIRAVGVRSLTGLARGLSARGIRPHMQICLPELESGLGWLFNGEQVEPRAAQRHQSSPDQA